MNRHHDPNPFDEEEVNPFSVLSFIFCFFSFSFLPISDLDFCSVYVCSVVGFLDFSGVVWGLVFWKSGSEKLAC